VSPLEQAIDAVVTSHSPEEQEEAVDRLIHLLSSHGQIDPRDDDNDEDDRGDHNDDDQQAHNPNPSVDGDEDEDSNPSQPSSEDSQDDGATATNTNESGSSDHTQVEEGSEPTIPSFSPYSTDSGSDSEHEEDDQTDDVQPENDIADTDVGEDGSLQLQLQDLEGLAPNEPILVSPTSSILGEYPASEDQELSSMLSLLIELLESAQGVLEPYYADNSTVQSDFDLVGATVLDQPPTFTEDDDTLFHEWLVSRSPSPMLLDPSAGKIQATSIAAEDQLATGDVQMLDGDSERADVS
jgi:hypothetical protein